MLVYGLTGGIGTGKSEVARMFREEGLPVVDADRIAREIVEPGGDAHEAIVRRFGKEVLLPDGRIDRKKLGDRVFADPEQRAALEAITHPRIAQGIACALARLEADGHAAAIVEAALIHEKARTGMFEAVIAVRCDDALQLRRLMARDGISEAAARKRLAAQMDPGEKALASDYVIDNSGDLESTREQVRALAARLKRQRRA